LHATMQQQAQIKQPKIAAPKAVMALLVDIPPFSPASSTKISELRFLFHFCNSYNN
jgi:hypothetical protein